jgi:hypothetical protein
MSKKQSAPQSGTDAPVNEDVERAKAVGKKILRQARAESGAPAECAESHAPSPDLLRELRVLLVDDEPDAREFLGLILSELRS